MKLLRRARIAVRMYFLPVSRDMRRSGRNSLADSLRAAWSAADSYWTCRGL